MPTDLTAAGALQKALHDVAKSDCPCPGGDIYRRMAERIAYLLSNNPGRLYEALAELERADG